MKQNQLITIVVPTNNRPDCVKRLLAYYSACQLNQSIIIADGSSEEIRIVNRETVYSFSGLRILYLDRYPPDTRFNDRLSDALERVNTSYCVICADDDFITPEGMNQSVDFLESNPDFSVAHGFYMCFYLESTESGKNALRWRTIYTHESIISPDPSVRAIKQLSEYATATFYAVHKTEFLKWAWAETLKHTEDTDILFGELLASTLTLVYGKMKCLDIMYSVKDLSRTRVGYVQTFIDYKKEGTYKAQYLTFRECLSSHLSKQTQLSIRKTNKLIDRAMSMYMQIHYPRKSVLTFLTSMAGKFMDRIGLHGPIRTTISRSYKRLAGYLSTKEAENNPYELPRSLTQPSEEIERIKRVILAYPTSVKNDRTCFSVRKHSPLQ